MSVLSSDSAPLKFALCLSSSPSAKAPIHVEMPFRSFPVPACAVASSSSKPASKDRGAARSALGLRVNASSFYSSTSSNPFFMAATQAPASAMRGAEVDVMGLLLRERILFLASSIDDFVADAIISQLLLLDAQDPSSDIRLFINSYGGSLSAAMAVFDVIQLIRADVSTIALGIAASTSSIILGGGTKGKRFAMPNTRLMIHQPLGGISGRAVAVEVQAREIMQNKDSVTRIISGFTGRTYEQVLEDIDRDNYMSPIEGVEFGIIDGVIDRDFIIPLTPVPEMVTPKYGEDMIYDDVKKFLAPEIPDDEIY